MLTLILLTALAQDAPSKHSLPVDQRLQIAQKQIAAQAAALDLAAYRANEHIKNSVLVALEQRRGEAAEDYRKAEAELLKSVGADAKCYIDMKQEIQCSGSK